MSSPSNLNFNFKSIARSESPVTTSTAAGTPKSPSSSVDSFKSFKVIDDLSFGTLGSLRRRSSATPSPTVSLATKEKEASAEIEKLFESAKLKVEKKLSRELSKEDREVFESLKTKLDDPKQAADLKAKIGKQLKESYNPNFVSILGLTPRVNDPKCEPGRRDYIQTKDETMRCYWRGCSAAEIILIMAEGSAGGRKTNASTGKPPEEEVIKQVFKEIPIFPEFTTDPLVAIRFARGDNYLIAIEANQDLFAQGSVTESGHICKHDAPVKIVAWKTIPSLQIEETPKKTLSVTVESPTSKGGQTSPVATTTPKGRLSIAEINEQWKARAAQTPTPTKTTVSGFHSGKILRTSPATVPTTPTSVSTAPKHIPSPPSSSSPSFEKPA